MANLELPDTGGHFRSIQSGPPGTRFGPKMKKPRRPSSHLEVVDLEDDEVGKENIDNIESRPKSSAHSRSSRTPAATPLGGTQGLTSPRPRSSRVGSRPSSTRNPGHHTSHQNRSLNRLSLTTTKRVRIKNVKNIKIRNFENFSCTGTR